MKNLVNYLSESDYDSLSDTIHVGKKKNKEDDINEATRTISYKSKYRKDRTKKKI